MVETFEVDDELVVKNELLTGLNEGQDLSFCKGRNVFVVTDAIGIRNHVNCVCN